MTFADWLKENGASRELYAAHHHQTEQEFWDSCDRADWMLWVAERKYGKAGWPDHIAFVRIAAACARGALQYAGPLEAVSRAAIEAVEAFADNPCEETRDAARTARVATDDAVLSAPWAAWDARDAARTAAEVAEWPQRGGARRAWAAAEVARRTAARVAEWSQRDAARDAANKAQADEIRRIWPVVG